MTTEFKKAVPSLIVAVAIILLGWVINLTTEDRVAEMINSRPERYTATEAKEMRDDLIVHADGIKKDLTAKIEKIDKKVETLDDSITQLDKTLTVQTVILNRIEQRANQ